MRHYSRPKPYFDAGNGIKSFRLLRKIRVKTSRRKTRTGLRRLIHNIYKTVTILFSIIIFLFVIAICNFAIYLQQVKTSLPEPNKLIDWEPQQSTEILDRNGNELYTIYDDQNRKFISLEDVPDHTKWAILAAEDIEFYEHKGLDLPGIVRAYYVNLKEEETAQGASTITQQLVKNTIMYSIYEEEAFEKTYLRKFREAVVSLEVERSLTKDEILQMYINEFPCGGVNYGLEACSEAYFGKKATDLTLSESAMLAGVIASPSTYSPIFGSDPEKSEARQDEVLSLMLKYNDKTGITEDEITAAREEELKYKPTGNEIPAPHFVFYIKDQLVAKYGLERVEKGGLRVQTTLDMTSQKVLEEEIRSGVASRGHPYGVHNGAGVILDPKTNQILAMVGSVDYSRTNDPRIDGRVNVTTQPRQMGSSVKAYTYLAAFERGLGPWYETPDVKTHNFGTYKPKNWDGKFYGPMVARQALVQSRNVPAVYTISKIGVPAFIDTAEKMGISTLKDRSRFGPSITLGAAEMKLLEHAQGFSVLATGGVRRDATGILKVTDSSGEVLEEYEESSGKRVFDAKDVYLINWSLCDLSGFGDQIGDPYYRINSQRMLCGKTGTTDGPRDLVAMQYHQNLVVAIWTGNNNNVETPGAWSTTVPLPIANVVMTRLSTKYPPRLYAPPAGIGSTTVCKNSGTVAFRNSKCTKVYTQYSVEYPPPYSSLRYR